MQSFLQYRTIGLAVQKQPGRDQEKATTWVESSLPPPPAPAPMYEAQTAIQHPPISVPDAASKNGAYEDNSELDQTSSIVLTRTRYSERTALGHALTGIHARDRTTQEGKGSQVFVVSWGGSVTH